MKKRVIVLFCLASLFGATEMPAQSLFKKIKNAAKETVEKKVGKKVENKVGEEVKKVVPEKVRENVPAVTKQSGKSSGQSTKSRQIERQANAMVGKKNNRNADDQTPTVRLPEKHTALFAPYGYPIEAKYGIKKAKPVTPPADADAQVGWSEKLPHVDELDNQSLVDEFIMLDKCVKSGRIKHLTPAWWRYKNLVAEELLERSKALDDMVGQYNEAMEEYKDEESKNWEVNGIHRRLAATLDSRAYKTVIRSSIAPLFTLEGYGVNDDTKAYFKKYGGCENAVKATLTVWNPEPDRKSVSSGAGQSGTVVNETGAGATVDIGGVIYCLHNVKGGTSAFVSEAVVTAVAGKDVVIPDYVTMNGKKYPVTSMRASVFKGTTIRSVKLPSTLREIPNSAFRETPITEITIPASVNVIQGSAFYGCKKLAKVVFEGNSMKAIHGCFQNCVSLTSIKFPASVRQMSYDMFLGCSSLSSVTLPTDLTQIYPTMFKDCKKLQTLAVPRTVTKVEGGAFAGSGIVSLDLSNVTEYGDGCFWGCKSLKSVKMNSSLKSVFVSDIYTEAGFDQVPALQVTISNDQYVLPSGITFVNGR